MTAYTPPGSTRERVFEFVHRRLLEGRPPTIREVQHAMGFKAVESARSHLTALVAEGRLVQDGGKARGYRMPDPIGHGGPPVLVPLLGRVPAGPTDLAVEEIEDYLPVSAERGDAELFALSVKGDSMRDAGILEGDVVFVRRQETASSGDIVVALIGDEATVKTLHLDRRRQQPIELRPENPDYEPIRPDEQERFRILGKVIQVRRYLDAGAPSHRRSPERKRS